MIHPTAIVHPGAKLGAGCEIGPYCVVGEHVVLGDRCKLHSHVVIDGHTSLGSDNQIYPFACLGLRTQDLKWKGGVTRVEIGSHNTFREYVTVHSATADGGGNHAQGSRFRVEGTAGQPDAGWLQGQRFTLQGGFWPATAAATSSDAIFSDNFED